MSQVSSIQNHTEFLIFRICFLFTFMSLCVRMHRHVSVWLEEESVITGGCELPDTVLGMNSGLLQEQHVLFTAGLWVSNPPAAF